MPKKPTALPATQRRVPTHTSVNINDQIRHETLIRLTFYSERLDEIEERLAQLEREWDIERTLQTNAATIGLAGILLGVAFDRRWLLLPLAVSGFLLQHSLEGWCPPMPVLRRLGFRTAREIDRERYALKMLRGDFPPAPNGSSADDRAQKALDAVLK